jgi:hypothetical protein
MRPRFFVASTGTCPRWRQRETTSSSSTSSSSAPGASTWPRCSTPGRLPSRRALRSGRDRPPRTGPGRSPHRRGRPHVETDLIHTSGPTTSRSTRPTQSQRGCRIHTGPLASRHPPESFVAGHIWQPGNLTRTCRYQHSSRHEQRMVVLFAADGHPCGHRRCLGVHPTRHGTVRC